MSIGVFILIPIYNDSATIRAVCNELIASGYNNIIVVDDGSDEDVFSPIADLHIHYLRHRVNLGQGAALQTGFEYANRIGASFVVTFDADGQHTARDIPTLLDPLVAGKADIVLGSRFLAGSNTEVRKSRTLVLKLATIVNYFFSGIYLSDAHNGLRAMNRKSLSVIRLTENGMAHASEILFEIKRHRLRMTEVPVTVHYTEYSRRKGQSGWSSIRILFDIVVHKILK